MNVLGIDPSLSATGIATGADMYTIRTEAGDPERLALIYDAVLVAADIADLAIVEDLPTHAHGAGLTGMAQGVIRLALIAMDVPYLTVPAATLKKYATGRGNATKADMRVAWLQRAGVDLRDDNQVDASWLRQIGLALLDDYHAVPLPAANRAALAKLALPEGVSK